MTELVGVTPQELEKKGYKKPLENDSNYWEKDFPNGIICIQIFNDGGYILTVSQYSFKPQAKNLISKVEKLLS